MRYYYANDGKYYQLNSLTHSGIKLPSVRQSTNILNASLIAS